MSNKINILLVDDDRRYCDILAHNLYSLSDMYEIVKSYSGKNALSILEQNEFDVVVVDLVLKDMDGINVIKRSKELYDDMQSIVISGHSIFDKAVSALKLGASNYLQKPFSAELLSHAITNAWEQGQWKKLVKNSERNYRSIYHNLQIPIFSILPHGRFINFNNSFCKLLNYSDKELYHLNIKDILSYDYRHYYFNMVSKIFHEDFTSLTDYVELKRRDESFVKVKIGMTLIHNSPIDNETILTGYLIEIGELTFDKDNDLFRNRDHEFEQLIMGSPNAVAFLKPVKENGEIVDFIIEEVNPAFKKTIGINRKVLKSSVRDFSNFTEDFIKQLKHIFENNETLSIMRYSKTFKKWFNIYSYKTSDNTIGVVIVDVSKTKSQERALQSSENLNNAILSSINANICVIDADGYVIKVNTSWDNFAKENGAAFEKQFSLNKNYLAICKNARGDFSDNAIEVYNGILEVLQGDRASFTHEYYCPSKEEDRWFTMEVVPLTVNTGGAVISHVNITQRKIAEDKMIRSQRKYKALFDKTINGSALLEYSFNKEKQKDDFIYKEINPSFTRLTGYDNRIIGHFMRDVHHDKKDEFMEKFFNVLKTGKTLKTEHYSKDKDSWYEIVAYKPKENHIAIVFSDITIRKTANEQLRNSEEKHRRLFETMSSGFVLHELIYDKDGNPVDFIYKDINPAFKKILGLGDEIIGKRVTEVLPDLEGNWLETYSNITLKGNSVRFERYLETFQKWFDITVYSPSKSFLASIFTDITDRKRLEKEMKQYREHLEDIVMQRSKELEKAHSELIKQERFATLGKLTATVSHEIRNPLGTISTSLHSIEQRNKNNEPAINRALKRAQRNVIRCNNIIEELLSYTRKRDLILEYINIDKFVSNVLSEQLISDEITFEISLNNDIQIKIDREKFRRCIINLIDNAVQSLSTRNTLAEGIKPLNEKRISVDSYFHKEYYAISITDTGPGISKENLDNIFEPLYSTKTFGVGLGLPIVKQIMEQHNGEIIIDSEEFLQTKAILLLPLHNSLNINSSNKKEEIKV